MSGTTGIMRPKGIENATYAEQRHHAQRQAAAARGSQKSQEAAAREKAYENWREARLDPEFQWERKRPVKAELEGDDGDE